MREMYISEDNTQNYVVIRDMQRGANDAAIVDWDVSDAELLEDLKQLESWEPETWEPFSEIMSRMCCYMSAECYLK